MTLAACGSGPDAAKTAPPTPVNAFTVGGVLDDRETATFAATVHFDREATLSFRLGGTVRTAPPQNGQMLPQVRWSLRSTRPPIRPELTARPLKLPAWNAPQPVMRGW